MAFSVGKFRVLFVPLQKTFFKEVRVPEHRAKLISGQDALDFLDEENPNLVVDFM